MDAREYQQSVSSEIALCVRVYAWPALYDGPTEQDCQVGADGSVRVWCRFGRTWSHAHALDERTMSRVRRTAAKIARRAP